MNDFELMLKRLENKEDYYAMFPYVLENSFRCKENLRSRLADKKISLEEYSAYSQRIETAIRNAIQIHLEWTIKRLSKNENHTVETIACSIYNDVFPGLVDYMRKFSEAEKQKVKDYFNEIEDELLMDDDHCAPFGNVSRESIYNEAVDRTAEALNMSKAEVYDCLEK